MSGAQGSWVPTEKFPQEFVSILQRVHLYPFRTQKLSSAMPTILAWRRVGKIGRCEHSGSWQVSAAWRFRLPDTKGVRVHIAEGPPVSIPNTEVKLCYADNTCLETDWEDRSMRTPGNQDRQHSIAVLFGLMRLTEISIFLLSSVGRAHDC